MDNLTHGALGIAVAVLCAPKGLRRQAALAGLIAAELPDADVFIVSPGDPLFSLQMHRHFTHALVMIPLLGVLGVLLANLMRRVFRKQSVWRGLWLPAIAAAATHGFCDVWTSYGTHVRWPFTDARDSLDLISVIDPLLTLPLLFGAVMAWVKSAARPAVLGLAWVALYLTLCSIQQGRARRAVEEWAASSGFPSPQRLTVKPSFGNIMVWRGLFESDGKCQVVCVRAGLTEQVRVLGTTSARQLRPEDLMQPPYSLPAGSVQLNDVRRFEHFSDGWLGVHPDNPMVIGDLRYATLPDRISPLWGIALSPDKPDTHVKWATFRRSDGETWRELWGMITGNTE